MSVLFQTTEESADDFGRRRATVHNAFVVSVTITAENGEVLTGNREEIFDDTNFPTKLRSVLYSTQSVPNAILKHLPQDRVTLFLDFSRPPTFDFSRLPTLPTPNESNFEIAANNEAWFVTTKAKLVDFFHERRSSYEWIHRSGIYDVLIFLVGIPLSVWACVRLEVAAPRVDNLSTVPKSLIYVYTFLLFLNLFRVLFSYSRRVFPKVEIESEARRIPVRHRSAWAFVMVAVLAPALYDLVKTILIYITN